MNSRIEEPIVQWVRDTVGMLVSVYTEIDIEYLEGRQTSVISVKVPKEEVGKLIGRNGIMADSFRTFINAYAAKRGTQILLHIKD